MNILVLNVGSSSIKYAVYNNLRLVEKKNIERLYKREDRISAINNIFFEINKKGIRIDKIGHRIVHGLQYRKPMMITNEIIKRLKKCIELAPLHEAPEIEVMEICGKLSKAKQYAVFDTGFFEDIPETSKIYGLPYKYYKKGIIRYGFHGISHRFVTNRLKGKVISCHLGSGASVAAVKNGKAIDMSMGFTPSEGLVMGTRTGNLDPSIIPYLIKHEKYSIKEINDMINNKSGLLGISGISADLRDLLLKEKSDKRAKLAVDVFVNRVVKYIGKYVAAMNGVDTIVFTAGIGERNAEIRKRICSHLTFIGLELDDHMNKANDKVISKTSSKVKVMVVPTDEEKEIMVEVCRL